MGFSQFSNFLLTFLSICLLLLENFSLSSLFDFKETPGGTLLALLLAFGSGLVFDLSLRLFHAAVGLRNGLEHAVEEV